jgi:hypothetical protein
VKEVVMANLSESLSHRALTGRLKRLAARDWQVAPAPHEERMHAQNGKRAPAEIGDAVIHVLADAGGELRMIEIHEAVEELLGEPVSRSSVKNYLAKGCESRKHRCSSE